MPFPRLRPLLLSSLFAALGCADPGVMPADDPEPGDPGMMGVDAGPRGSGAADSPPEGSRAAYCAGHGPPVTLPGSGGDGDACLGRIAETVFRHAVCACEDLNHTGRLETDSYDSASGAPTVAEGGPVGVNGAYGSTGPASIGGSLTVANPGEVLQLSTGSSRIGGDLETNGGLRWTGTAAVARDVWATGEIVGTGLLEVGRDVHAPSMSPLSVRVGGRHVPESVPVEEPCHCGSTLDIPGAVSAAETDNHNDDVGLDPDAYVDLVARHRFELPCGRFYLRGVEGTGHLTFVVSGRTALFIDGDVRITGGFDIELRDGAEIDLLIAGDFSSTGSVRLGDPERAAATRVYVGGSGEVRLTGGSAFVGNVYAPNAPITTTGGTEIYGAVFGRRVQATGSLRVHYDRAVLETGDACPPPPEDDECDVCGSCPDGLQCVAGSCLEACTSDADCCGPTTCNVATGACEPILLI